MVKVQGGGVSSRGGAEWVSPVGVGRTCHVGFGDVECGYVQPGCEREGDDGIAGKKGNAPGRGTEPVSFLLKG